MTRLIDADALLEKFAELEATALEMSVRHMRDADQTEWKRWSVILTERTAYSYDVLDAPTVDAVPVIRCKDCKYWLPHSQFGFDEDNDEYYDYCELLVPDDDYYAITRQADDFCSRAERKDNG